jgi:hypothetical protein
MEMAQLSPDEKIKLEAWKPESELLVAKPRKIPIPFVSLFVVVAQLLSFIPIGFFVFMFWKYGGKAQGGSTFPLAMLVIIIGFAIFGFFRTLSVFQRYRHLLNNGEPVAALVKNVVNTRKRSNLDVRYTYQGIVYEKNIRIPPRQDIFTGDVITILLEPSKPTSIIVYPKWM